MNNNETVRLTTLEASAIKAVLASEYDSDNDNVGKCVWNFSILDHSDITKAQLGGVLASLSTKGFMFVDNSVRGEECVTLLQAGYDAYVEFTALVMACPNCLSTNVTKDGKTASGDQKIKCKECGKRGMIKNVKDESVKTAEPAKGDPIMPETETVTPTAAPTEVAEVTAEPKAKATKKKAVVEAEPAAKPEVAAKTGKRRANDIYERNLYTVTRCMDESGLEGKELNKLKFNLQRALGKNEIEHEVEQLSGRQWRRVFSPEAAHKAMAEFIPGFNPANS